MWGALYDEEMGPLFTLPLALASAAILGPNPAVLIILLLSQIRDSSNMGDQRQGGQFIPPPFDPSYDSQG
jgi:hypothetical protein